MAIRVMTIDGCVVTEMEMRDTLARMLDEGPNTGRYASELPMTLEWPREIAIDVVNFIFKAWGDESGA